MTFGVLGSPGEVISQAGSVLRWPVSVIAVAYPLARNSDWSTGLAEEVRVPASPPTPLKMNFPFQLAGSIASKLAEFGPAPSPEVVTEPFTSQYCGFGAAAGTLVAELSVIFGTARSYNAAALQSIAAAGIAAPPLITSTARQNMGIKTPCLRAFSTRVFICGSSCRSLVRCPRVIS